ncbi:glycosyl transferase [Sulfodiicoccus acidiphilus]|uniref:Glycosyl transferase n=1 Tax=Sulfodiicoccus acidiphilus TaxID=1670455 RepID=A0A348B5P9_9CREN|nr:glycosyltransferase family 4 protein [Sulfodiicoccus acidiphilus]BBD73501.1 glycosyl transferase [Sulfodiicoccus acidiphilus]GGT92710.1 glycosyl transferase [Sulfodiicoccus acidiphilus]
MDLLVLNHRDPLHPAAGGAEAILFEVLRRLARWGVEVTWMSERFPGSSEEEFVDEVRVKRKGGAGTLHIYAPAEAKKHEVVLDSVAHAAPFFSYLVNPRSAAVMYHVHQDVLRLELDPLRAALLRRLERFVRGYHTIVSISETTKRDLVKRLGVAEGTVRVILSGIDHQTYKPGERSEEPLILWIGRLKKYKNPLDAVAIYRHLSPHVRSNVRLVMAGDGDQEGEVREAVEEVGGTYVGRVQGRRKVELYQRAWVVLSTSFVEGWGMTVVEANACGTPVVAYAVGSLPEVVKEGVNGFTVPYRDVQGAAKVVEEILTNEEERLKLWSTSYLESLNYDWERTARGYLEVLRDV